MVACLCVTSVYYPHWESLGDLGGVEPPVPISNTVVKRPSADDTEGATLCGKYATARRLIDLGSWLLYTINIMMVGSISKERNVQQI